MLPYLDITRFYDKDQQTVGQLQYTSVIPSSPENVFSWFQDYKKLHQILPPHLRMEFVMGSSGHLRKGADYQFQFQRGPFQKFLWEVRILDLKPNSYFVEEQVTGVFERWENTYLFEAHGDQMTKMTNRILYRMPLGLLGSLLDDVLIKKDVLQICQFAHDRLIEEFKKK